MVTDTQIEAGARALAAQHGQVQYDHGASNMSAAFFSATRWQDYVADAKVVLEAADRVTGR